VRVEPTPWPPDAVPGRAEPPADPEVGDADVGAFELSVGTEADG
jgi:hypothetical protein